MSHPEPTAAPSRRRDPLGLVSGGEGAITGTVVCAAAIAYGAGHLTSTGRLCLAILGTVAVYWLAHVHAVTLGNLLTHRRHPAAAVRHALGSTAPIAAVSVLPVVVLLVSELCGAALRTSSWIALVTTIALLTTYSYVAGVRGGLGVGGRIASAGAGAGVGVLVALLKVALH